MLQILVFYRLPPLLPTTLPRSAGGPYGRGVDELGTYCVHVHITGKAAVKCVLGWSRRVPMSNYIF